MKIKIAFLVLALLCVVGVFAQAESLHSVGIEKNLNKLDKSGVNERFVSEESQNLEYTIPISVKWVGGKVDETSFDLYLKTIHSGIDFDKPIGENIPLNKDNGYKITVTVDLEDNRNSLYLRPKNIDGFVVVVKNVDEENYSFEKGIRIIYIKDVPFNLPVSIKWVGREKDGVNINLIRNGTKHSNLHITKDKSWNGVFERLALWDFDIQKEIEYDIEQEPIEGYTTKIQRVDEHDLSKGFIITNTEIKNTEIKDTKTKDNITNFPKTGDKENIISYIVLAFMSLFVAFVIRKKAYIK